MGRDRWQCLVAPVRDVDEQAADSVFELLGYAVDMIGIELAKPVVERGVGMVRGRKDDFVVRPITQLRVTVAGQRMTRSCRTFRSSSTAPPFTRDGVGVG